MRRRDILLTGLAAAVAPTAYTATPSPARAEPRPAVLELFTSQGCSSCPPADALLGQLASQPGIIALAWHVDYWNGLGWHDPYSTPTATERQRRYAAALHDEVYTPALVVNGARMVVGSDAAAVHAALGAVDGFAVNVTLRQDAATWVADIAAANQPVNALLATYDPQHTTQIGAGENGGRKLTEYRIVRAVTPLGAWNGAARRITLPAVAPGLGAALLVQSEDLQVRGAATLPPV
jgi:hypothetical protein